MTLSVLAILISQTVLSDSLESRIQTSAADTNRVNLLNQLSIQYQRTNSDRARTRALEARELARSLDFWTGEATADNNLGITEHRLGHYGPALDYYLEAVRVARLHDLTARLAGTLNNIGLLYYECADYAQALTYYFESLNLKKKLGDRAGTASTLNNIGLVYKSQGNLESALDYFIQSLVIKQESDNAGALANSHINVASIFAQQDRVDSARFHFTIAESLAKQSGDVRVIIYVLHERGLLEERLGQDREALADFQSALQMSEQSKETLLEATSLEYIGRSFRKSGRIAEAIPLLHRATTIASSIGAKGNEASAASELALVYLAARDFEKAYRWRDYSANLNDSIFSEDRVREMGRLESRLDLQRKERENESLRLENRWQREQSFYLFGLLALSVVLVAVALYALHQKRVANRLLEQKALAFQKKNADLQDALEKLEDARIRMNEFLAIAAHDLRGPLATIISMMSLIHQDMQEKEDSSDVGSLLGSTIHTARQATSLVNSLLNIAAMDSGKIQLDCEAVDMRHLVKECIVRYESVADRKDIRLQTEFPGDLDCAWVDRLRTWEVVDNLISNAIKFTYPGGLVTVRCHAEDGWIVTEVGDTGQGMSDDDIKKAFQSFSRLSAKPTAGEPTTGLGLVIVRKIVELHGGRVWVESTPRQGSQFRFTVPAEKRK